MLPCLEGLKRLDTSAFQPHCQRLEHLQPFCSALLEAVLHFLPLLTRQDNKTKGLLTMLLPVWSHKITQAMLLQRSHDQISGPPSVQQTLDRLGQQKPIHHNWFSQQLYASFQCVCKPLVCFVQCKQATAAVTAGRRIGPSTPARQLSPRNSSPACCALSGCTAAGSAQHDILHALLFDCPVHGGQNPGLLLSLFDSISQLCV